MDEETELGGEWLFARLEVVCEDSGELREVTARYGEIAGKVEFVSAF